MVLLEKDIKPLVHRLDPPTVEWLERLSRVTGDPIPDIIASMLRMIRLDDEQAHETQH